VPAEVKGAESCQLRNLRKWLARLSIGRSGETRRAESRDRVNIPLDDAREKTGKSESVRKNVENTLA